MVLNCNAGRQHQTSQSVSSVLKEVGQQRELMMNVAMLTLQYFRHVVRGGVGEITLAVLEGMIDGIRYHYINLIHFSLNV